MERFWMTTRGLEPNELGAWVRYADAQRALDAEREKVKELVANQAEYEKCTDEQITALNQGCLDYEKQIATLQAQLADRDAMILQMGEQAAVLAKENMAVKAQLRQVEGERDHAKKMEAVQKEVADNQTWHVRQLRQLVEVWRKLLDYVAAIDRPLFVRGDHAETYEARCQYIANRARAALAAQDAGKEDVSHE